MKIEFWLRNMFVSILGTVLCTIIIGFANGNISDEIGLLIFFGFWLTLNQRDIYYGAKKNRKDKKKKR